MSFGAYKIVRKVRAISQLRNALLELQELDPTGKLAGATDALLNRPPKCESGPYDEAYSGIRSAGIAGILSPTSPRPSSPVDY